MHASHSDAHAAPLFLAVVVALAFVGYLVGTGEAPSTGTPLVQAEHEGEQAATRPVSAYLGLRDSPRAGTARIDADLLRLRGPGRLDPVDLRGSSKPLDLAERALNRAYAGAPPTIPHPVRQDSAAECMACHEEGLRLYEAVAAPVPHEAFASCTQCHVVQEAPMPGARLGHGTGENAFVGLESPVQGPRAWSIAPPVTPHPTFLREQCLSCHGPNGRDALRSTHPERESCTQCHAIQNELSQSPLRVQPSP
jgi:nitrate reductase (cytochrome), electron transfer subunit